MADLKADRKDEAKATPPTADADGVARAEAKRLDTRRRVLLGLAAVTPMVITFGRREALAADEYVCVSLGDMAVTLPEPGGTITCTCNIIGSNPTDAGNDCKPIDDSGG